MRAFLVAIGLMLTAAAPASAENWTFIGANRQGDVFEIDLDSVMVWRDGSVSVKVSTNGDHGMVPNFDCNGHFVVIAPVLGDNVQRIAARSTMATIERNVCAMRSKIPVTK